MGKLLRELGNDVRTGKLLPAVAVGTLTGALLVIDSLLLANVIFNGPLSAYVGRGVGLLLFGYAAFGLLTALTSSYPGMIGCPQYISAAVLAPVAVTLGEGMRGAPADSVYATMVTCLVVSGVLTSAACLGVARGRITDLLRIIPYPVACGALAGTGAMLCLASLYMMGGSLPPLTDAEALFRWSSAWTWGAGAAFGIGLVVINRVWNSVPLMTAAFAASAVAYHQALGLAGMSVTDAQSAGLLFAGLPNAGEWPAVSLGGLPMVDWSSVAAVTPNLAAVTLVTLFTLAVNLHSLEIDAEIEVDKDREFAVAGWCGLAAAVGGSAPGCQSFGYARFSHMLGADSRLTGIVAAGVVAGSAAAGGGLLTLVPIPLAGGVLLYAGIDLLGRWLVRLRPKLSTPDYGTVVLTCAGVGVFGFVEGMALGLLAAMTLLLARLSGTDVVSETTSDDHRRTGRRTIPERAILIDQAERIRVWRLHGFVFFGNVHQVVDSIRKAAEAKPTPACIVLDVTATSGFDFSALQALCRFIRSHGAERMKLAIAGAPPLLRTNLESNLTDEAAANVLFEKNADDAIERAQDMILAATDESMDGHATLLMRVFDEMQKHLDGQIVFEKLVDELEPWLEPREYEAGESLAREGESQAGTQLIVKGRASSQDASGARIAWYGPGTAVEPEAAFRNVVTDTSTVAEEHCRTMLFTPNARLLLEALHPALGLQFYRFLVTRTHGLGYGPVRARTDDGNAILTQLAETDAFGRQSDRPSDDRTPTTEGRTSAAPRHGARPPVLVSKA